ncbi:hypothetical protein L7F22_013321 [Adiantum nelumboides]|nr:hypothetical protein [Adiantum nelumboides]
MVCWSLKEPLDVASTTELKGLPIQSPATKVLHIVALRHEKARNFLHATGGSPRKQGALQRLLAMREQVVVLPPSTEKKKASFTRCKKDEPLLHHSKDSWKRVATEDDNAENIRGFVFSGIKDLNHIKAIESVTAQKMKTEVLGDGEDDFVEALKQEVEGEGQDKGLPSTAPLLQWGQRKRSRCSRADNHNSKPCDSPDDSAVLCRKTVRVQADKALPSTSPLASKGNLKSKNGALPKKDHLYTAHVAIQAHAHSEKGNKQAKLVKNGLPDLGQERNGSPLAGSKRGCPASTQKQELQKKTCTMPDLKGASQNTCVIPSGGGEASPSKAEFVWPKFVIDCRGKRRKKTFSFSRVPSSHRGLDAGPKQLKEDFFTVHQEAGFLTCHKLDTMLGKRSAPRRNRGA